MTEEVFYSMLAALRAATDNGLLRYDLDDVMDELGITSADLAEGEY